MREPKFRAWDKITKKYYAVSTLEYADNGELCEVWLADILVTEPNDACRNLKDVVLEQCAGFKDKNGKEIYEGDIIHIEPFFKKKGAKRFRRGEPYSNPISVVEWDEEDAAFNENHYAKGKFECGGLLFEMTSEWECLEGTRRHDVTVIGNIHENPELLKEEE